MFNKHGIANRLEGLNRIMSKFEGFLRYYVSVVCSIYLFTSTCSNLLYIVADSGQAGNWCVSLLKKVFEHTPHNWSAHTLQTFPTLINEFYTQNPVASEDKQQLQSNVDAEFQRWICKSISVSADFIPKFCKRISFLYLIFLRWDKLVQVASFFINVEDCWTRWLSLSAFHDNWKSHLLELWPQFV